MRGIKPQLPLDGPYNWTLSRLAPLVVAEALKNEGREI